MRGALVFALALGAGGALEAQVPVRAHPMGDPMPGRAAPAFVLPYARAEGPGPGHQPFALRAELGRVVVLLFSAQPADSGTIHLLRSFATRFDALVEGDVVVAAVLPLPVDRLVENARSLALPFKLLSDPDGAVRRMFGIDQRELGVYVIGLTGRVEWRDVRFDPFTATSYENIRAAVARAWGPPGGR